MANEGVESGPNSGAESEPELIEESNQEGVLVLEMILLLHY